MFLCVRGFVHSIHMCTCLSGCGCVAFLCLVVCACDCFEIVLMPGRSLELGFVCVSGGCYVYNFLCASCITIVTLQRQTSPVKTLMAELCLFWPD